MRLGIIKYILLISIFFISNLWAQVSSNELSNVLAQSFSNLSSVSSLSYNVTITTLEANNITNTYKANVNEIWLNNSYYALYKLNNNQLLFTYNNSSGLERFWFGRSNDLPEIKLKDIDAKFLNTAISYSTLNINPLWLSIPVDSKYDQGFFVIQSYNKTKYSNFSKVEYYINKDNIPIRILYYNNISNFPVLEILVTDYRKVNQTYIIYKMEYKDNSTKKTTILEKTDVSLNSVMPEWIEEVKVLINNNINTYNNFFMVAIRKDSEIVKINKKDNMSSYNKENKEDLSIPDNDSNSNVDDSNIPLNNELNLNYKNDNDELLKALNEDLNDIVGENKVTEVPSKIIPLPNIKSEGENTKVIQKNRSINKQTNTNKKLQDKVKNKPVNKTKKIINKESDKKSTIPNNNSNALPKITPEFNKNTIPPLIKESKKETKQQEPTITDPYSPFQDKELDNKKDVKKKNTLNNLF